MRGPAVFGETEVVHYTMLDAPTDEMGRVRRTVSATVANDGDAVVASFNWKLFDNVVCQNAVRGWC